MKLFRQLFFVWIAIMFLPHVQGHSEILQRNALDNIHVANHGIVVVQQVEAPRVKATINRFKRRPVGINDSYGHEKVCPPLLSAIAPRFIYVDNTHRGYYFNPYLSVPIPLRSWRGPPTA